MSNEHTHDPQEPTGARLSLHMTNDDMERLRAAFSEYSRFVATDDRTDAPRGMPTRMRVADSIVSQFLYHLLADRVALVAEVARLEAEAQAHYDDAVDARSLSAMLLRDKAQLQATNERIAHDRDDMAEQAHGETLRAAAAGAQNAAMRPLVEALANSHASNLSDGMRSVTMPGASVDKARALVATWQPPAAPTTTRPTVVCLCGSTRFSQAFHDANLTETLAGRIVLSIGCDMRSDTEIFGDMSADELAAVKKRLDDLHKQKIALADEILVLNVGGYTGDSTRSEIAYARAHGKRMRWLETPDGQEGDDDVC